MSGTSFGRATVPRGSCPGVATKITISNVATVGPNVTAARAGTPGYFTTSARSARTRDGVREMRPFVDVTGGHAR
jgi:hypothetical protein